MDNLSVYQKAIGRLSEADIDRMCAREATSAITPLEIRKVRRMEIDGHTISIGSLNRQLREDETDEHRHFNCFRYDDCLNLVTESPRGTFSNGPFVFSFSCQPCPLFRKK